MRQPVGVESDENRAADREQAEARPGEEQRQEVGPCQRLAGRLRLRHAVDDAAEEHRLGELRDGQRQIGADQNQRQPRLRTQKTQHPRINLEDRHRFRPVALA